MEFPFINCSNNKANLIMKRGVLIYSNSLEPLPAAFVRELQHNYDEFYVIQMLRHDKSDIALPEQFLFDVAKIINVNIGRGKLSKIFGFLQVLRLLVLLSPVMISAWNWELILLSKIYSKFSNVNLYPSIQDTREWMYTTLGRRLIDSLVSSDPVHLTSLGYAKELFSNKSDLDILILPNVPIRPIDNVHNSYNSIIKTVGYFGFIRGDEALNKILSAVKQINRDELKIRFLFAGIGPGVKLVQNCAINGVDYLGSYDYKNIGKMYAKVDAIFGVYDKSKDKLFHSSYRFMDAIHYGKKIFLLENSTMYEEIEVTGLAYPLSFDEDWATQFQNFIQSDGKIADIILLEDLRKKYVFRSFIELFKKHYSVE